MKIVFLFYLLPFVIFNWILIWSLKKTDSKSGIRLFKNKDKNIITMEYSFYEIILAYIFISTFSILFSHKQPGFSLFISIAIFIPGFTFYSLAAKELAESWRFGICVDKESRHIVRTGVYAYSRNPALVGLTLIFLSFAILADSTLVTIFFIAYAFLQNNYIKEEENSLQKIFKEEYLDYYDNVPRYFELRLYESN